MSKSDINVSEVNLLPQSIHQESIVVEFEVSRCDIVSRRSKLHFVRLFPEKLMIVLLEIMNTYIRL